jgi:hypothetical protein
MAAVWHDVKAEQLTDPEARRWLLARAVALGRPAHELR